VVRSSGARSVAGTATGASLGEHRCGQAGNPLDGLPAPDSVSWPDRAFGALQPPDVEAVDAHPLTGPIDDDVLLGTRISGRLVACGVAGDQP
jgi:hypothetical protein